jgi:hypothetical protein
MFFYKNIEEVLGYPPLSQPLMTESISRSHVQVNLILAPILMPNDNPYTICIIAAVELTSHEACLSVTTALTLIV